MTLATDAPLNIVDATAADYTQILVLNELAVPHVNLISEEELADLHDQSCFFKVAKTEEEIAAFLIALPEEQAYESLNYRWFSERYEAFVYVDRIVVAASHRGSGVGKKLYSELFAVPGDASVPITCEVNLEPPNPNSLAFHASLGFTEVGQQETEGGSKRVSLLAKAG